MRKLWVKYLIAYGMWIVFTLAGIYFVIISRTSLVGFLDLYFVPKEVLGTFQRGKEAQFIDKAYLLVASFIVLILMIVVEEYFKHGARRGDLAKRLCRVFGREMLFIFAASLASAFLVGFSPLIWLALFAELIASIVMIYFGAKLPGAKRLPRGFSEDGE